MIVSQVSQGSINLAFPTMHHSSRGAAEAHPAYTSMYGHLVSIIALMACCLHRQFTAAPSVFHPQRAFHLLFSLFSPTPGKYSCVKI